MQRRDSLSQPHEQGIRPDRNEKNSGVAQPTPAAPVVISSTQEPPHGSGAEHRGNWPITAEWALVIVTIPLAFFTYRLWAATKDLVEDAQKTAIDQRKAMENQRTVMAAQQVAMEAQAKAGSALADAALAGERAYVFVDTTNTERTSSGQPAGAQMGVHLVNLGKTPAYVDSMYAQFALWDRSELIALAAHPPFDHKLAVAAWLGADKSTAHYQVTSQNFSDDVRQARSDRSRIEALLGQISYMDVFGRAYETGFAFEWLPESNRLQPIANPQLNYTREKPKSGQ